MMHIGDISAVRTNSTLSSRLDNNGENNKQGNIEQASQVGQIGGEQKADLARDIKEAINSSLVHQLFSALSRSETSLFKNYKSDIDDLSSPVNDTPSTMFSRPSGMRKSSFPLIDFSASASFSIDVSFSQTISSDVSFSFNQNNVEISASLSTTQSLSLNVELEAVQQEQSDPLILDLDRNGFSFSSPDKRQLFDIDADGQLESISRLNGQDAFLAIDRNQNGQIDNGLELFGDAGGAADGFADLRRFDLNDDLVIDAHDRIYDQLLLLSFKDNGEQQLTSLSDQKIKSISLASKQENVDYDNANQLVSSSTFEKFDGEKGMVGDFLLGIGAK